MNCPIRDKFKLFPHENPALNPIIGVRRLGDQPVGWALVLVNAKHRKLISGLMVSSPQWLTLTCFLKSCFVS